MEFWGVEVKEGKSVKVDQIDLFGAYIHLSQVALGESKKEKSNEPVVLYLKVGEQKLVLGTLIRNDIPQLSLDLVLDQEFELSHSSKNSSVHFLGYRVEENGGPLDGSEFSETDSEDELALNEQENGKPFTKAAAAKVAGSKKPAAAPSTKQVKIVDPKKDHEDESDDDSDDDDDESNDEDESGSPDEIDSDDEDDSDEDEDDEEDEETPAKKVDQGKKRPNESASKTPVPAKKAKNATPEKTDGKKGVHTATPHPMKKGGKTPNSASKAKTPLSGGQLSCKSCSKVFISEFALQQHKKSKHGGQ